MIEKAKKRNRSCKKTTADVIVSTAKRRKALQIRRRGRGGAKATATTAEKRSQSCLINRLPRDALMAILSTLRVKSLLQLRCVCKSWYTLISNIHFVKTHLNRSITSPNILRQRQHILISNNLIPDCPYAFSLESAADNDEGDIEAYVVEIDYIVEKEQSPCSIIGSCHGLLCLKFGARAFYVCNLSTRESKRIPDFKFSYWKNFYILGFGYDHSVDDYKLVKGDKNSFHVYSLRTDSWKKVQGFPNNHWPITHGILLNGAIHWLYVDKDSLLPTKIVAFCLADEKFLEFPVPTLAVGIVFNFGLLGGCLCILPFCGNEFWLMKEYGVTQSWTKVVIEIPSVRIHTLALLKNHEAILKIDSKKLVLYNTRERTYRDLVLRDFPDVNKILNAEAYVESLVSPCQ
ncbi:F-box/kelch-repeat protein At3g06240-like isoform X1 [Cornus florida]|uniref:F-box/kelch-repeat protein At3g06240-like isoform X1 n=1 Tax=Cornus florida TaxID=4283 RepID=UPI0028A13CC8|nr:F-box/kelch-repeat protein At3g06240-like isoform X1 [Cornus florida]XP_059632590.1 F-box/kelch-repeat protein At3g06240-like isoform X1 [Cornus florida]XP_059632591.1 F-box/kelch-repeat protein At3g06240-like isoform X1 [Cornus florida]XP_059632592.1 F-box/kelch-repeat protein At3g06240-like isoform X1 [Cornus florida]